jgi:hypothetical protein
MHLREMTEEQRQRTLSDLSLPDAVRADLQLLVTVATLWGSEALGRFQFTPVSAVADTSRVGLLLEPFRRS